MEWGATGREHGQARAHGRTTLTFADSDGAGNTAPSQSESLIVGPGYACATPTPRFSLPDAGTLDLVGTAVVNGTSLPFKKNIAFD